MIKEIIFDCFGVLTQDGWLAFLHKYGSEETLEELRYLNHQADRGMLSYQDFLERVTGITGASKAEAHKIITTNLHPNEAVFKFAHELKKSYRLGIISNVGSPLETYLPAKYLSVFDTITLSMDVGYLKPEPEIYSAHLEEVSLYPEETIFIDDREINVDGAKAAGMGAVLFHNVDQLKVDLQAYGIVIKA